MYSWQIVTGEYPAGGVGDYTRRVASAFAQLGDEVHVWAPRLTNQISSDGGGRPGVSVHRLPGRFGPRDLLILDRAIGAARDSRILVEYVPHAFGFKAMNLAFCSWLRVRRSHEIFVMFHEVSLLPSQSPPLRHRLLRMAMKLMACLLVHAASRIFVATESWKHVLEPMIRGGSSIEILPVPSNVDVVDDVEAIRAIRRKYAPTKGFLVGHFSAHPPDFQRYLTPVIPALLSDSRVRVMLIGTGSKEFKHALDSRWRPVTERLHATGELDPYNLSLHLSACDLMLQPYPDGITTRRSSSMAAIAHGRAVVTTAGKLTEPIWFDSAAVCMVPAGEFGKLASEASQLLDDPGERGRLGLSAAKLYRDKFDLRHTVSTLRA